MQIETTFRDMLTPALQLVLEAETNRKPYHEVMGMAVVSISKRSFTDASLRAAAWAAKHDGSASTLQRSTSLRRSVRVVDVTDEQVTVGSDKKYAAIHQLGGRTPAHVIRAKKKKALFFTGRFAKKVNHPGSNIPARPFIPITTSGLSPVAAQEVAEAVAAELKARLGFT